MSVSEWIGERAPAAPAELRSRVIEVLGSRASRDAAFAPGLCLDAAAELLRQLVGKPRAGREAALDLLTADALVTYAFEAGAAHHGWIEQHAPAAMAHFASVAQAR